MPRRATQDQLGMQRRASKRRRFNFFLKERERTARFVENRQVHPVHRFDCRFERFSPGSLNKQFFGLNRTGFMAGRRSDRSVQSVIQFDF